MPESFNNAFTTTADVVLFAMACTVLVVFAGCIYAFFYAIYLFIFSKWDDKKKKQAFDSIRYMVIGLFLTIMLLFIWPQALRLFKIQDYQQYTAKNVFTKIWVVITGLWEVIWIVTKDYPWTIWIDSSDTRDTSNTSYQL